MRRAGGNGKESGYMLLFLMLAVAVLMITMLGVARNYRRSIVRDREVEMMHRGDQYSRAIKRFYKKNGSYPTSLEQLEKMNNIRYLRKRYKDPMSPDGVWKLVHPTDVKLTAAGGLTPASTAAGGLQNPANAGALGGVAAAAGALNAAGNNTGIGSSGTNSGGTTSSGSSDTGTATGANGNPSQGTDTNGGGPGSTGTTNNPAGSGQVLGGGPVLGVVSKRDAEGIHSFGEKKKYNEWFFIYDPSQDRGQMLVGPYNPNTFVGAANAGLNASQPNASSPQPGAGTATTPGSSPLNSPAAPTPVAPTSSTSPTPPQ